MGFKTRKQSLMHNTFLPLNVIQNGSQFGHDCLTNCFVAEWLH